MGVLVPQEGYLKLVAVGQKKAALPYPKLILQGIAGGLWIGVYGHCCTYIAGAIYVTQTELSHEFAKLVYAGVFPGALIAIMMTGAELYTGNTMTMLMACMAKKTGAWDLFRVWIFSLLFNFVGCTVAAGFSYLTAFFDPGTSGYTYLCSSALGKVGHGWGRVFILAMGCNMLVCLGTWHYTVSGDAAGKVLVVWATIGAFVLGGLEHIVANFYTIWLAYFTKCPGLTFFDIFFFNWVPVFIGNTTAGVLLTGMMWWYSYHPRETVLDGDTQKQLLVALASRVIREELIADDMPQKVTVHDSSEATMPNGATP